MRATHLAKRLIGRVALFVLPLLAAGVMPAKAQTTLCIESTAALIQAVNDIDGSRTEDITLRLRSGTYNLSSDLSVDYRHNGDPDDHYGKLTISGGWTSGCLVQVPTLGSTTINGSGGQRKFRIEVIDNPLRIDHISSNNIDWSFTLWVCYLRVQDRPATLNSVRFLNTRVAFFFNSCFDVYVQNSLIVSRPDSPSDVAIVVSAYLATASHAPSFWMTNSTVRGGKLLAAYLPWSQGDTPPPAEVKLYDNVFENDGTEVDIEGANVYSSHNRYDSLSLVRSTLRADADNISAAPLLQSTGVPQNNSPLVNAGTRFVPGGLPTVDLAANERQTGTHPDIGAFETAVNNSAYLDVTTTSASGSGSFAQAVADANFVNGAQTIRFNLSGACPRTITLASPLTLTDDTTILGETQAGTQANSSTSGYNGAPCIILTAGAGVSNGLIFQSSESGDNLRLSQIAFSGFTGNAVNIRSGRNHLITGNQFGGSVGATALIEVGTAIRVETTAGAAQIGGQDASQTNLIGNASFGIWLSNTGSGDNAVLGNAIGERSLFGALPNGIGMVVYTDNNLIENNLITRSISANVLMATQDSHHNTFRNNVVSRSELSGLVINGGSHNNRVGPNNTFSRNNGDGIGLVSGSFNDLSTNTYFSNGDLAIDLGATGVTPNDPDPVLDGNTTPNRGQNYPVLTRATAVTAGFNGLVLQGSLSSTLGTYRMDIYRNSTCSSSGHGEGATLLATRTIDLDCTILAAQQCAKSFSILLATSLVAPGDQISTIVTSPGKHTSEFSACQEVWSSDTIFKNGFQ